MLNFRKLSPDEISVKAKKVTEKKGGGVSALLLLYKDARVDMAILDETVGAFNWQNRFEVINNNLFCTVDVFDSDKNQWVSKSNVGTESQEDAEKGEASDSFKRACTNWGIGRELYTSPQIWVDLEESETYKTKNGNVGCKAKFKVKDVGYTDGKITSLVITNEYGKELFIFPKKTGREPEKSSTKATKYEPESKKPSESITTLIHKGNFTPRGAYDFLVSFYGEDDAKRVLKDNGATAVSQITYEVYQQTLEKLGEK